MNGANVLSLATSGVGRDADGERAGFVELVRRWMKDVEGMAGR